MPSLFEEICSSKQYKELLEQLPEDERAVVLRSLKELVDKFENSIVTPIKNLSK